MHTQEEHQAEVTNEEELEARLVVLTNAVRARYGAAPLSREGRLTSSARNQARRCKQAGRLSHDLGGSLGNRVKAEGYRYRLVGENLAKRFPPAENILKGWLDSPGHRRNLLEQRYTETGIGVLMDGRFAYACAIYAKPPQSSVEEQADTPHTSSIALDEDHGGDPLSE